MNHRSNTPLVLACLIILFAGAYLQYRYDDLVLSQYPNKKNEKVYHENSKYTLFTSYNPNYGIITDPDFQISENAAFLKRNVAYCQWVESGSVYAPTYKKEWTPKQINSANFYSSYAYRNNPRENIPEESQIQSFYANGYYIDNSMINPGELELLTFVPNYTQLISFTKSNAQRNFRYIGNGVFYSEANPGQSSILRNQLGQDTNGKLTQSAMQNLFDTCTPGDIAVHFTVFNPKTITISGISRRNSIYSDGTANSYISTHEKPLMNDYDFDDITEEIKGFKYLPITVSLLLIAIISLSMNSKARIFVISVCFIFIVMCVASLFGNDCLDSRSSMAGLLLIVIALIFSCGQGEEPHRHQY